MRFLIDANLPRSAVRLLVGLGHFVDIARDIGLASAPDEAIARRAQIRRGFLRETWISRTFAGIRRETKTGLSFCAYLTTPLPQKSSE